MAKTGSIGELAESRLYEALGATGSIVQSFNESAARHLIQAAECCDFRTPPDTMSSSKPVQDNLRRSVDYERLSLANHGRTLQEFVCPPLEPEQEAMEEIERMMQSKFRTMVDMLSDADHMAWRGCGRGCRTGSASDSRGDGASTPRASESGREETGPDSSGARLHGSYTRGEGSGGGYKA